MKKVLGSVLFGLALILAGCFSSGSNTANADSGFEYPFEKVGKSLYRTIDCNAGIVIYSAGNHSTAPLAIQKIDDFRLEALAKSKCTGY